MSLLSLVVVLLVVGLLLWLVTTYIPLEPTIRKIIVAVVVIVVVLWLLQVFGLIGAVNQVRVPQIR